MLPVKTSHADISKQYIETTLKLAHSAGHSSEFTLR